MANAQVIVESLASAATVSNVDHFTSNESGTLLYAVGVNGQYIAAFAVERVLSAKIVDGT